MNKLTIKDLENLVKDAPPLKTTIQLYKTVLKVQVEELLYRILQMKQYTEEMDDDDR